jgi:hypothetical protein
MAGMPYVLLTSFGIMFYLSVKKAQRKAREAAMASTSNAVSSSATPGSIPPI